MAHRRALIEPPPDQASPTGWGSGGAASAGSPKRGAQLARAWFPSNTRLEDSHHSLVREGVNLSRVHSWLGCVARSPSGGSSVLLAVCVSAFELCTFPTRARSAKHFISAIRLLQSQQPAHQPILISITPPPASVSLYPSALLPRCPSSTAFARQRAPGCVFSWVCFGVCAGNDVTTNYIIYIIAVATSLGKSAVPRPWTLNPHKPKTNYTARNLCYFAHILLRVWASLLQII